MIYENINHDYENQLFLNLTKEQTNLKARTQAIIDSDHANGIIFKTKENAKVNDDIISSCVYLRRVAR